MTQLVHEGAGASAGTDEGLRLIDPVVHVVFTLPTRKDLTARDLLAAGLRVPQSRTLTWVDDEMFTRLYRSTVPRPLVGTAAEAVFTSIVDAGGRVADWLPDLGGVTVQRSVRVYPQGMCAMRLSITLPGEYAVAHVNAFISQSLDGRLLWRTDGAADALPCEALLLDVHQALRPEDTEVSATPPYLESFSVVEPTALRPQFTDAARYREPEWEKDLFSAAIRRVADFGEVRLDVARERQKNLSIYVGDLVYLNYNHLLVYVVPDRDHLPASFYIDVAETVKVLVALLHRFDVDSYRAVADLEDVPSRLGALRRETEALEVRRFEIMRALDTWRMLTAVSASRSRWFLAAVTDQFGVATVQAGVQAKLNEIELVLGHRYNVSLQRTLQLLALGVGILSLLATGLGIFVSIAQAS
ncbi:MAG: hypothetical protein ABWY29_08725 [Blastococcus sp.]